MNGEPEGASMFDFIGDWIISLSWSQIIGIILIVFIILILAAEIFFRPRD